VENKDAVKNTVKNAGSGCAPYENDGWPLCLVGTFNSIYFIARHSPRLEISCYSTKKISREERKKHLTRRREEEKPLPSPAWEGWDGGSRNQRSGIRYQKGVFLREGAIRD
jgi:hypothetical protein